MFIWGCKWKSTSALNRFVFIYNKCVCVSKINYFVLPIFFFLFFFYACLFPLGTAVWFGVSARERRMFMSIFLCTQYIELVQKASRASSVGQPYIFQHAWLLWWLLFSFLVSRFQRWHTFRFTIMILVIEPGEVSLATGFSCDKNENVIFFFWILQFLN